VRAGATVLIASHEIERAQGLGGRSVELAGGTIQPAGNGPADGSVEPPMSTGISEDSDVGDAPADEPAEHPEVAGVA
jgi:hypothetical protein